MNKMYTKMFVVFAFILISGLLITGCKKDETTVTPTPSGLTIVGIVVDAVTTEVLVNADLTLSVQGGAAVKQMQSGNDGTFKFEELNEGYYSLVVSKNGYKNMQADSILVTEAMGQAAYVALTPVDNSITQPVGGVSGFVVDVNGQPIADATISISADSVELTNGYFASSKSNASGQFFIGAIPINDFNGNPIPSFKLRCIKNGYTTAILNGISIKENKTVQINFTLTVASPANVIWEDNFESNKGWALTGYWHRFMNSTTIKNKAYMPHMFVKLAPGDNSNGSVPLAFGGSYTMWYGEDTTGNFLGQFYTSQDTMSGGTGNSSNRGNLTSPTINLTSTTGKAALTFWTWWEIESVNPNAYGFDIMEVEVIDVADTSNITVLGKLNPYSDPILDNRASLPYTSGGFNKAPVWYMQEYDLTDFIGKTIKLRFAFDTRDALYNGFRGWFVDDVKIMDKVSEGVSNKPYKKVPAPVITR